MEAQAVAISAPLREPAKPGEMYRPPVQSVIEVYWWRLHTAWVGLRGCGLKAGRGWAKPGRGTGLASLAASDEAALGGGRGW